MQYIDIEPRTCFTCKALITKQSDHCINLEFRIKQAVKEFDAVIELFYTADFCCSACLNDYIESTLARAAYAVQAAVIEEVKLWEKQKESPCTNPDTTIVDETKTEQLSLF
jgi:hypothetical protein